MHHSLRRIFSLFEPHAKKRLVLLLVLLVCNGFAEMISLGLIMPFLTIAAEAEAEGGGAQSQLYSFTANLFGNPPTGRLVLLLAILVAVVFLLRNLFLGYIQYYQQYAVWQTRFEVCSAYYRNYLRLPLTAHLNRSSTIIVRNITTGINEIFVGVLMPAVLLLSELIIIGVIGLLLLIANPLGTIVAVLCLGGAVWLMQRLARSKLNHWSEIGARTQRTLIASSTQALQAIKEIKVMGRENFFVHTFDAEMAANTHVKIWSNAIGQLPRLTLETLVIWGILAVVSAILLSGSSLAANLPVLGLFGVAALRFVPSFGRINQYLSNMRLNKTVLDELYADHQTFEALPPATALPALPFDRSLTFDGVTFRYPGRDEFALSGVSFTIGKGESVAFVGPSGSGKTTILNMILGLLSPNDGDILVDGVSIRGQEQAWQACLAFVSQEIFMLDGTLRDNILFGDPAPPDEQRLNGIIKLAQLEGLVNKLPQGLETPVGERGAQLSGGERQRVGIARALYASVPVLVLDEATSALDVLTETAIIEALAAVKGTRTIITVAHRLSTVRGCDRLFFVNAGRVANSGSFDELMHHNVAFAEMAASMGLDHRRGDDFGA